MVVQSIIDPIIPPAELTQFIHRSMEELPVNSHIGERFMPSQTTASDRWTTGITSTRDWTGEAEYRAWNTEPTFAERQGVMRVSGNIVPIGQQMLMQEDIIRDIKFNRERGISQTVIDAVFNDAATLLRKVQNRVERARWEALDLATFTIGTPGEPPYTENNLQMKVDFDRDEGNRYDVPIFWDIDGSTPFLDELALMEIAEDKGIELDVSVMGNDVIRTLLTHQDYRDMIPTLRVVTRLTVGDLNAIRAEHGLPVIVPMTAKTRRRTAPATTAKPEDGYAHGETVQRFFTGRVIYMPTQNQVGSTMWGLSSYVGESEVGNTVADTGGPIVFLMKTLNPVAYYTVIDAVVVPVLWQPDDVFSVGALTTSTA